MGILQYIIKKTILNWNKPLYSKALFTISSRYVDMWYGDNNYDRNTNGEYRLLKTLMPSAKIAFDVGANDGEYSSVMHSINPNLEIHTFEPDPKVFEKLKKKSVIANNFALGEKVEERSLSQMNHTTHNSFYNVNAGATSIKVYVSTLDAYIKKMIIDHIDFLKIDVEGHEYFVLKGAIEALGRGIIDYIQFEFSGATADSKVFLKDFIELFEKYGYSLYRIRAKDVQVVEYRPDRERFTLTNFLAIKKGLPIPKI